MARSAYRKQKTSQISFPLGGIGSGCIGLGGNGRFVEWEIFNRPNKGGVNGFSHFAIKAEGRGRVLDARALLGDLPRPYTGSGAANYAGFGFGPGRETVAGLPHFRDVTFRGEYPFADLSFREPHFPGRVTLRAFNPLIPLNDKDSSLPAALFAIAVRNTTRQPLTYTIALTVRNPLAGEQTRNAASQSGRATMLRLDSVGHAPDDPQFGDLTLATDAPLTSWQEYWFRGQWFDNLGVYWHDFITAGKLQNRQYDPGTGRGQDHATLAAHLRVAPGQDATARFLIAWSFPNCVNYWNPEKPCADAGCTPAKPKGWKNYYATVFHDSADTAAYALANWDRLESETQLFKDTLFRSTLPAEVIDAVSANIAILKTPTVLRLEDGSLYGWEGCSCGGGCCEGSCTHVWNYAYALPFLFPRLERSMRELDYRYNLRDDGGMPFRLQLPAGRERSAFRPCADGQFGGVIKVYREWKISGDTAWLRALWPSVRKSIEFAWAPTNTDRWDPEKTGVLWGRQHHTLDMELFGPNAWLTGFYLAALRAGAEMAEALGAPETAQEYRRLLVRGSAWVEADLYNGAYYHQKIDLDDRAVLAPFETDAPSMVGGVTDVYWDREHGEIKYQIGAGCGIDQVLAQWHASLIGLGPVFDPARTRKALASIYRHNFKRSMRDLANPCRLYCLNDEAGTVMIDWQAGRRSPVVPIPYAEETMHGFEYQAACHMIMEGLVREGLDMVRAVRDRYDGERRNPWNEFECGNNYARSMASYALLPALSGFRFDMTRGMLGFDPVQHARRFRCFWSLGSAWGEFLTAPGRAELRVLYGRLDLRTLRLPFIRAAALRRATLSGRKVPCAFGSGAIEFAQPLSIGAGETLAVRW